MSRPMSGDPLQGFRFHAYATGTGNNYLETPGRPEAGFSAVTIPEVSSEAVEYREGRDIYTTKMPGPPTVGDATFSRGVTRAQSPFLQWMRFVVEGGNEYRADIHVLVFHRDAAAQRSWPIPATDYQASRTYPIDNPSRVYHLGEAFPTRCKVGGDLDATAGDVSIEELDVACETISVEEFPTT